MCKKEQLTNFPNLIRKYRFSVFKMKTVTNFYFIILLCVLCFWYMLVNLGLGFNTSTGQGTQISIFLPIMVKVLILRKYLDKAGIQSLSSHHSEYLGEGEHSWGLSAASPVPGESRLPAAWVCRASSGPLAKAQHRAVNRLRADRRKFTSPHILTGLMEHIS